MKVVLLALLVSLNGFAASARKVELEDLAVAYERDVGKFRFPVVVVDYAGVIFENDHVRAKLASPCKETLVLDPVAETLFCEAAGSPAGVQVIFARFEKARKSVEDSYGPSVYTFLEFDRQHVALSSVPNFETQEFDHVVNVF